MITAITYSDKVTRVRSSGARHFGQIKKDGRKWHAEMRDVSTGDLIRFAGIWDRKRDAIEEVTFLLGKPEHL